MTNYRTASNLQKKHGFFTRRGGVSTRVFDSLNLVASKGDTVENVIENHRRVKEALGATHLLFPYQVHGNEVLWIGEPFKREDAPKVDGLLSTTPGMGVGIVTADCMPVLLAHRTEPLVGALHAGWRGLLSEIVPNALNMIIDKGYDLQDVFVASGPCAQQANYEVGPEVREAFLEKNEAYEDCFVSSVRENHFLLNMPGILREQLNAFSLGGVEISSEDTYTQEDDYFSYRRTTHRGEKGFGCQASAIVSQASF